MERNLANRNDLLLGFSAEIVTYGKKTASPIISDISQGLPYYREKHHPRTV